MTFDEFADRFLKEYVEPRCRSNYYEQMLKPLRAYFGRRLLRSITVGDLDRYRASCMAETSDKGNGKKPKIGASTIRKLLTVLGTLFRMARRWGLLEVNPAADLPKPAEPKHKTRYLSQDEWLTLQAAVPPWLRPLLQVAVATGMRLKEVVNLRWEDIDRKAGLLHVAEETKTGTRAIPITGPVREILNSQVRHVRSSYVFLDGDGQPYTSTRERNRVSQVTRAVAGSVGLRGVSFHTLRHTFASWMASAGVELLEIQRLLGHSTPTMTARYSHLRPEHLRRGVEAVAAVMTSEAEVAPTRPQLTDPQATPAAALAASGTPPVR